MRVRHEMPFGATVTANGVRFAVWAPAARAALLHVDSAVVPMERRDDGFFERTVAGAAAGSRYAFSFDDNTLRVPDPASRFNPDDVHGSSEVIDPESFDWSVADWRGRPWQDAVIYELHVGSFTFDGTYAAAEERLDHLVALGVTAVELMPLADTPGRHNWGYDGVLPFAPESGFGRPHDLKRFVDAAHRRGLMVLLDVVYNHFGPDGNYLHLYAPQFFSSRHRTPWGKAINFDGAGSRTVRDFFVHNALYWLEEYRFDGLRLDAAHAMADDSQPDFLTELASRVARLDPHRELHLVLENDRNEARYLRRGDGGAVTGWTAQWNDDWHHALHVVLTGERKGHYMDYDNAHEQLLRATVEGFDYQGETSRYRGRARGEPAAGLPPAAFVNFLQNHDQIGNRPDGKRLWQLAPDDAVRAAETLLLLMPTPILLFMGDELHSASAFPFFCDFHGELAAAVTSGRRRELAKLACADETPAVLPAPNSRAARDAAVIDWRAAVEPAHAAALERYRRLLGIRAARLLPLLPASNAAGTMLGDCAFAAVWQLARGARLNLLANLAPAATAVGTRPAGTVLTATVELEPGSASLPPWYVAWSLELT